MPGLDADTWRVLQVIPVKGKVDETVIDEAARRAFVGDKTGMIEVIGLDRTAVAGSLPSEPNVHTSRPLTRAVYVWSQREQQA